MCNLRGDPLCEYPVPQQLFTQELATVSDSCWNQFSLQWLQKSLYWFLIPQPRPALIRASRLRHGEFSQAQVQPRHSPPQNPAMAPYYVEKKVQTPWLDS